MKLAYIYPESLPTQKARGVQVINTCAALANYVERLFLYIESSDSPIEEIFSHYGLIRPKNLEVIPLKRQFGPFTSNFLFSYQVHQQLKHQHPEIVITRHLKIIDRVYSLDIPIILESHQCWQDKPKVSSKIRKLEKTAISKVQGIAFLTPYLQKRIQELFAPSCPQLIIPSGTTISIKKENFYLNKKESVLNIVYLGTIRYRWKGVHVLFQALERLKDIQLHLIGPLEGAPKYPLLQQLVSSNRIKLYGYIPNPKAKKILQHFHIGVLPNTEEDANSRFYTSPLKLLDYMAAQLAIIASDLPSIREMVSPQEVFFVTPGNPDALAQGIKTLLENSSLRVQLAQKAWKKALQYSWEQRAKKFMNLIQSIL